MSEKCVGAETYREKDVSDGLVPKTNTLKCNCGSRRRVGVDNIEIKPGLKAKLSLIYL